MDLTTKLSANQLEQLAKSNLIYDISRVKTVEDAIQLGKASKSTNCAHLINILSNYKISSMTAYILYRSMLASGKYKTVMERKPSNLMIWLLSRLNNADGLEGRFSKVLSWSHNSVAKAVEEVIKNDLIAEKDREKYKLEFETFIIYIGKTELIEWIVSGEQPKSGFFPWMEEFEGIEYPLNITVGKFSVNLMSVLGRAGVMNLKQVYLLNDIGSYSKLLTYFRGRTHVNVNIVIDAIYELRQLGYFDDKFIWDSPQEIAETTAKVSIKNTWIYELQDGVTGGFVLAVNEQDAKEKVCAEFGIPVGAFARFGEVYPITCLDLNKPSGVHKLW